MMWVLRVHQFENCWPKPSFGPWFCLFTCLFVCIFCLSLFCFSTPFCLQWSVKVFKVTYPPVSPRYQPIPRDLPTGKERSSARLLSNIHSNTHTHECYDHDTVTVSTLLKVVQDTTLISQGHRETWNKSLKTMLLCAVGSSFGRVCLHYYDFIIM